MKDETLLNKYIQELIKQRIKSKVYHYFCQETQELYLCKLHASLFWSWQTKSAQAAAAVKPSVGIAAAD